MYIERTHTGREINREGEIKLAVVLERRVEERKKSKSNHSNRHKHTATNQEGRMVAARGETGKGDFYFSNYIWLFFSLSSFSV